MIEEFRVKLGDFIKNKRESISLSREDLAKELEVSRVTVSNIEQGAHNIAFVDLM
jgi:transcriptional regulator with XRE-family HTH domain